MKWIIVSNSSLNRFKPFPFDNHVTSVLRRRLSNCSPFLDGKAVRKDGFEEHAS